MIVNRQQLGESIGVSLPTIDAWVREGMPVVQRGGRGVAWEFDLAACVQWYGEKQRRQAAGDAPTDIEEAKRRKVSAEAEMAELEVAKAKSLVAPIDEFKRVEEARRAIIRTNVLNVVSRATLQLLGETDESVFKKKLRAELVLALETAAKAEIELADDDATQDDEE